MTAFRSCAFGWLFVAMLFVCCPRDVNAQAMFSASVYADSYWVEGNPTVLFYAGWIDTSNNGGCPHLLVSALSITTPWQEVLYNEADGGDVDLAAPTAVGDYIYVTRLVIGCFCAGYGVPFEADGQTTVLPQLPCDPVPEGESTAFLGMNPNWGVPALFGQTLFRNAAFPGTGFAGRMMLERNVTDPDHPNEYDTCWIENNPQDFPKILNNNGDLFPNPVDAMDRWGPDAIGYDYEGVPYWRSLVVNHPTVSCGFRVAQLMAISCRPPSQNFVVYNTNNPFWLTSDLGYDWVRSWRSSGPASNQNADSESQYFPR